jgi:nicotinamide riboside kinase
MTKPYVITIVGPESSGKTTLASNLANQLGCLWVPEYARAYLDQLDRRYELDDLALIAEGQRRSISEHMERAIESKDSVGFDPPLEQMTSNLISEFFFKGDIPSIQNFGSNRLAAQVFQRATIIPGQPLLIVDSGLLSLNVWAKLKYNKSLAIVDEYLKQDETSAYVLCRPTLPWIPDPLREAPGLLERVWIYNHYLSEIVRMMVK